jgi:hypothetical protein
MRSRSFYAQVVPCAYTEFPQNLGSTRGALGDLAVNADGPRQTPNLNAS